MTGTTCNIENKCNIRKVTQQLYIVLIITNHKLDSINIFTYEIFTSFSVYMFTLTCQSIDVNILVFVPIKR